MKNRHVIPAGESFPVKAILIVSDGTPKPFLNNVMVIAYVNVAKTEISHIRLPFRGLVEGSKLGAV